MLYSGFNILLRSVFWSAYLNGRSDNLDVISPKPMPNPKNTHWLVLSLLLLLVLFGFYRYAPINFAGTNKEIDLLIDQLASKNADPNIPDNPGLFDKNKFLEDTGEWDPSDQKPVSDAYYKLKAMGKDAFPFLLNHFDDQRYSHQRVSATFYPVSVGEACRHIIDEQVDPRGMMYKSRESPNGSEMGFHFEAYVRKQFGSYAAYVRANRTTSLRDMRIEVAKSRIAHEKSAGFVSEEQRNQMLGSLERLLENARQKPETLELPVPDDFTIDALVYSIQLRDYFREDENESRDGGSAETAK